MLRSRLQPCLFCALFFAVGKPRRTMCKRRGRVIQEWAVLLKRHEQDWAPVPDLTYISYERLPKSWKRNEACPIPPELVIEILSLGQTFKDFEDKAKDYFAAGVSRVWVVDPDAISINVFYPNGSSQVYTDTMPMVDELLPGLELTVKGSIPMSAKTYLSLRRSRQRSEAIPLLAIASLHYVALAMTVHNKDLI